MRRRGGPDRPLLRDQHDQVQGKLFVDKGTVLYSDLGKALFTVVEDTCGRHDTIYGCCSEPNNFLRYGVRGTHSCFANFVEALAQFGLDRSYIVSNVNFFMSVPVAADGEAVNVYGHSAAGNYVDLRAERDVLAVLSNCPQMHNPCNAYNLTPIRAIIWRPSESGEPGARRAIVSAPIYHLIPNAPKPVAPYSHVVEADGWLFVTGQLATDPDDDSLPLPEGIEAQTRKVMDNLRRALAGAGAGFEHVVCVRIFLTEFRARLRRLQPALHGIFRARPAARTDHGRGDASGARRHRRGRFDRSPFLSGPHGGWGRSRSRPA